MQGCPSVQSLQNRPVQLPGDNNCPPSGHKTVMKMISFELTVEITSETLKIPFLGGARGHVDYTSIHGVIL